MSKINIKKNIIFNYIGQLYIMLVGIVMLPFYLKYLGAEAYGLVGFFTMLTSIMMLLDIGLSNTLSREAAKLKGTLEGYKKLKITLRSIESVILPITIIVFLIIFFQSNWIVNTWLNIKNLDINTVEICIKLMGFMIAIRWFVGLYYGVIVGYEQQVWLNIYKISIYTLKFVGGLILVVFISNNILDFFIYQTIISIVELSILSKKVYSSFKTKYFVFPSYQTLKIILPFALSVAYTSLTWAIFTRTDKFLLSHYISLKEYGYFALVVAIGGAIMQFSGPISQAVIPRMTNLISQHKEKEMLVIYRKSTRVIAILIVSVVGIIVAFPYELLFSWTGDNEASNWASPILFWYSIGNGFAIIVSFQYYLQYAYGNLKYQNKFNTFFPIISLPIIFLSIVNYGAYGSSITWFILQFLCFLFWTPFIHSRFAPDFHWEWLIKDMLPPILVTIIYINFLKFLNINFSNFNRLEIFIILVTFGIVLLFLHSILYKDIRNIILNKINFFKTKRVVK